MHLDRLVAILEAVAFAGRPVSASDLNEVTELPLPTCYRLLQMLKEQKLLDETSSKSRFVIGDRFIRIALLAKTDAGIRGTVAPKLKEAATELGEAVFLSRFRKNGVGIVHVETPEDPDKSYFHPGLGNRPLHACSCAKAIAAFADDEFREFILSGPMKSYTNHTLSNRDELQKEYTQIQKSGFAECVEEIQVGVSSVAAPIKVANIGAVFSVGVIGPIDRFHADHRQVLGKKIIGLAGLVGTSIQASHGL